MLKVALDRQVEGDLIHQDIGDGLPFRGASFDNAISISAIQWLCHSNTSKQNPVNRLRRFFQSLFACLTKNGRAVLQFYPENPEQGKLIQSEAIRAGFSGGVLIDFPNSTRAKKYFMVLNVNARSQMPDALDEPVEGEIVKGKREASSSSRVTRKRKPSKDSVAWVKSKKERAKRQKKDVPSDSKYTGRKRKPKF